MKEFTRFTFLAFMVWTVVAQASSHQQLHNPVGGRDEAVPAGCAVAPPDTVCLLGSKGTYASYFGNFEDNVGAPSWDRWYGVDLTQKTESKWHIDTYNANTTPCLDSSNPNHAWWCGEDYPSCAAGDPVGGYGNNYLEYLDWWGEVTGQFDPDMEVDVYVDAKLSYDIEPGYDHLCLQFEDADYGMMNFATPGIYNGKGTCTTVAEFQSGVLPVERFNHPGKWVHLRWCFTSDGTWSDADCDWPTEGAAQLDQIEVSFAQGIIPKTQQGATEDCESGGIWEVAHPPGYGDYALVWDLLHEIDPCCVNNTPQVAFVAHPATGLPTYPCTTTWCYGPDGYVVNHHGGAAGLSFHLHNEIWSPIMVWPPGDYDGAVCEFTVFRHEVLSLAASSPGMFFVWHVRSTTDDNENMWPVAPGSPPYDVDDSVQDPYWPSFDEAPWSEWRDRNFVYYGGPNCICMSNEVSNLLMPARKYVQVALGVYELGWIWGYEGSNGTPAPYFDDVRFCAYAVSGPAISTREIQMAQDNFPTIGAIEFALPCKNSIRFDAAWTIAMATDPDCNVPGDTITFDIVPVRTGTSLLGTGDMVYKMKANPIFDLCRTTGVPTSGSVPGGLCFNSQGIRIADRYNYDLPDTGFFFPGDVIHYFIKASDSFGGTTTLPGDTTGFSLFPGDPGYLMMQYPTNFVVRGLPSLKSFVAGDQPRHLWWNDFANRGLEEAWYHAFYAIHYTEGFEFDTYYTNGPSSGVGNGLGGRATATQLAGYDMILYSSGDLAALTLSNGDCRNDPGADVAVLDIWLWQGNKSLFLTGNDLIYDLNNSGPDNLAFENTWIQAAHVRKDVREVIADAAPAQAYPLPPGNIVFNSAQSWAVYSACNPIVRFPDAIEAEGIAVPIAEWLDPVTCNSGVYLPINAGQIAQHPNNVNVITLPYDLGWVIEDTPCTKADSPKSSLSARAELLRDVLTFCGSPTGSVVVGTPPGHGVFAASAYPSPFNPKVTIEYSIQQPGRLTIQVYDVRGQLVRTVLDAHVADSGSTTWWGDDDRGNSVASGVYMIEISDRFGHRKIIKAALIK